MVCDYEYVASLCCKIYAKKSRSKSQQKNITTAIAEACGKNGMPLPYDLVEYFAMLAGTTTAIKMYLPVILANICYVDIFESTPSIMQTQEQHAWVLSHVVEFDTSTFMPEDIPGKIMDAPLPTWRGDHKSIINSIKHVSAYEHWASNLETLCRIREASNCQSVNLVVLETATKLPVIFSHVREILPRILTEWCVENQAYLRKRIVADDIVAVGWKEFILPQGSEYKRLVDKVYGNVKIKGKHRGESFRLEIPYSEYLELEALQKESERTFVVDSIGARLEDSVNVNGSWVKVTTTVNGIFDDDGNYVDHLSNKVSKTARTRPKSIPGHNAEKPWLSKHRKKF